MSFNISFRACEIIKSNCTCWVISIWKLEQVETRELLLIEREIRKNLLHVLHVVYDSHVHYAFSFLSFIQSKVFIIYIGIFAVREEKLKKSDKKIKSSTENWIQEFPPLHLKSQHNVNRVKGKQKTACKGKKYGNFKQKVSRCKLTTWNQHQHHHIALRWDGDVFFKKETKQGWETCWIPFTNGAWFKLSFRWYGLLIYR